ncbi:MAG: restriction endonuclease subunit S [Opitutaceae bacterium]
MAQELYELPQGWEWKELNSICEKTENIAPNKTPSVQFNYVDISAIDREKHIIAEVKEILGKDAPSRAKKEIKPNDILFATTRPNLKNIAVYDTHLERPVASTGFCILRSKQGISHNYIFRFLLTDHLQSQISDFISGAQYPAITDKNLKRSKIPVPPLAEQERIVAKLDALFSRIDQAIAQLQHTQAQTKALFASALDAVFSEASQNVKMLPFGEVVDNLDGKRIPIKASERKTTKGTYPYYGATGIIDYVDDFIFSDECLLISEDGANLVARKYPIAFIATGKYWVNNHAHVVSAKKSVTTNHFLEQWFSWISLASYITGAAQPKLSQKKMNSIPFPLVPLAEQSKIVAQLDAISERTQALTAATSAQLEQLQSLKASLLDAAFRGQL